MGGPCRQTRGPATQFKLKVILFFCEISLQPQPPHQEMLRLFTGSLFYKLHCKMGFYAAQVEKNHLISRNRKFYKLLPKTNAWLLIQKQLCIKGGEKLILLQFAIPTHTMFKSFHMDSHFIFPPE